MNAAQDRWLRQRAVAFESRHSTAPLSVREQTWLDHILGDARVIALGEMTHGAHEIFESRARLLKFLIRERKLSAVIIEACFGATQRLNAHLLTGEGTTREALAATVYWSCVNRETLDLMEWIREHNASPEGTRRPVSVYGCDVQSMDGASTALSDLIEGFWRAGQISSQQYTEGMAVIRGLPDDRELQQGMEQLITEATAVKPDMARIGAIQAQRLKNITDIRGTVAPATQQLHEFHHQLPANAPSEDRFHFQRCVRLLEQVIAFHSPDGFASRDASMAENVMAIAEHLPQARLALLMHNLHVARAPLLIRGEHFVPAGRHLARRFENGYRVVGSAFYQGTYLAAAGESAGGNEIAIAHVPRSEAFECFLQEHAVAESAPDLLLDFSITSQEDCPWPSGMTMRSGEAGPQGDYAEAFLPQSPATQFDGLIYLADVTPTTVLPEYFNRE